MKNILGNKPVSGRNYHGRDKFVRLLETILTSGGSILLLGLRRIGKSSTIAETLRKIKVSNPSIELISVNCQNYKGIEDFYKNIYLTLPKSWQDQLRKALKNSKKIPTKIIDVITDHIEEVNIATIGGIKLRNDIISYANPLKEEITNFFKKQNKDIVLFIDELPFLFETINNDHEETTIIEIETILTTLREWREIGISQAICGSLNLHLQLEQMGISHKLLAGLISQQLPSYTEKEARGLLTKLAKSYDVDLKEIHITAMLKNIPDFIPQFLQIYFKYVALFFNDKDFDINKVYQEYVYTSVERDFEYQFDERWASLSEEELIIATQIMNLVLKQDSIHESTIIKQVTGRNAHSIILKLLNHEFLVKNANLEFSFSLILIKNWWKKKNL